MVRKLTVPKITGLFLFFFLLWGARIVFLSPLIDGIFPKWEEAFLTSGIKSILWLGFGLFFIRRYDCVLPIKMKAMFTEKINGKLLLSLSGIFLAYQLAGMLLRHRGFYISPSFHPSDLLGMFLLVGILEEVVFRGWFMNALSACMPETKANVVSALFFMVIHYPRYFYEGTFRFPGILFTSVFLFSIGLVFGWVFRQNRCIWTPAILHSVWDLLAITIGGV